MIKEEELEVGTWYKIVDKTDKKAWQARFLKIKRDYERIEFWTDICIDSNNKFDGMEGWFDFGEITVTLSDLSKDVIPYLPANHPDKNLITINIIEEKDLSETWNIINKLLQ